MDIEFGIDLGTSNLLVAALADGPPRCLVGSGGGCPPVVAFGPNGPVVGSQAALRAQLQPELAVTRWKWLLGRPASSRAARRVAAVAGLTLVPGEDGEACVLAAGAPRSPTDLVGLALRHVVDAAGRASGETPADLVVGVPAAFDTTQRMALVAGARRTGLVIDRLVRDTTAVALAELEPEARGLVAIVDAGAAKVEVAIVDVSPETLEVIARRSDVYAGADDVDARACEWLLGEIEQTTGERLEEDLRVGEFLRQEVAAARRSAGASPGASLVVRVPFLEGVEGRGLDACWEIPRARFALLVSEAVERVAGLCALALTDAGVTPDAVSRVILTGGLGRLAEVRARTEASWRRPARLAAEGAVARGAAFYGAALRGRIPLRMLREEQVPEGAAQASERAPAVVSRDAIAPPASPGRPLSEHARPPSEHPRPSSVAPPPVFGASAERPATMPVTGSATPVPSSWPSQAPPREYASTIPPAPAPPRPAATLAVPRSGRFKGVLTASDLAALPLTRAATPQDLDPAALPLVLLHFGAQKDLTGVLTVRHGTDSVQVLLYRGTPTMSPSERARAQKAFAWRDGDYAFAASTDVVPSQARRREPVAAFILGGLRPALRGMADSEVSAVLGGKAVQSPVLPPDRMPRVERLGLNETEQRMVAHQFDGTRSLIEMFEGSPLGRQTLARLVLVLDTFGAIEWRAPKPPPAEDMNDVLSRRLERMKGQNHFEVVGVHWSVGPSEIAAEYDRFRAMYGPGSPLFKSAPDACRAILDRGAAAWAVLSNDPARLKHRKEAYPEIDPDLLAPLLASRANALAMKGEMGEAKDMQRLLGEVSPRDALTLRDQLKTPGIPTRPSGAPKDTK